MNLEIVFNLIRKAWKQILLFVLLATLVTGVLLFFKKPYYRSAAIFTAANPNIGDRSNIYRTEFWEQYFYFGGEFDNDRLLAIAKSEEMNRFIVDTFQLRKHYKIKENNDRALYLADYEYKENVTIQKNEYGHVKVNVWDTDKKLAAEIANTIVKKVNEKSVSSLNNMKAEILQKLQNDFNIQKDTLLLLEKSLASKADAFLLARKTEIISQLNEKEKLIQQFNTSINNVSALFVIENALPALKKDKPKIIANMILAAVLSLVFSILLLLVMEWKKNVKLS